MCQQHFLTSNLLPVYIVMWKLLFIYYYLLPIFYWHILHWLHHTFYFLQVKSTMTSFSQDFDNTLCWFKFGCRWEISWPRSVSSSFGVIRLFRWGTCWFGLIRPSNDAAERASYWRPTRRVIRLWLAACTHFFILFFLFLIQMG